MGKLAPRHSGEVNLVALLLARAASPSPPQIGPEVVEACGKGRI